MNPMDVFLRMTETEWSPGFYNVLRCPWCGAHFKPDQNRIEQERIMGKTDYADSTKTWPEPHREDCPWLLAKNQWDTRSK